MVSKKALLLAIIVLPIVVLLVPCDKPVDNAIRMGLATAPSNLDPRLATDAVSERINHLLYQPLVNLDQANMPIKAMADWQKLSDQHYRFTLLKDRPSFWHADQPTAQDVVATYTSILQEGTTSPHRSALAHIKEIKAVSRDTVEFYLSKPDPRFLEKARVGIVPAEAVAEKRNLSRQPLGSGPFKFSRWQQGELLSLVRRSDDQAFQFVPVKDETMRVLKLLNKEIDLLQNELSPELFAYLGNRDDVSLQKSAGTTFAYIGFNLQDDVVGQLKVRQAIAHAIDRDAIIKYLFMGNAHKAESVLTPAHWAGNPNLKATEHAPEKAKQLLAELGFGPENPLTMSYKTSTDPFRLRIAAVFQEQLAKVGIKLTIRSYDWGTFFGDIKAGRFQMYSLAWVGVNSPDIFRYIYHSESLPPKGANRGHYVNKALDGLIDKAEKLPNQAAAPIYREIQQQIHEDLVYVPLWYEMNIAATAANIAGYRPANDGNYDSLLNVNFKKRR